MRRITYIVMSKTSINPEPVKLEYLQHIFLSTGAFYYWPNDGNLGDYLIAEATRQMFRKWGLEWKEYHWENPPEEAGYTIVYGGGGRFVPHWGGMDVFLEHLTRQQVKRCIILPHSINGVETFVKALDERHTVFCRERKSLAYCQSYNTKAEIILAHDLGLYLQVDALPTLHTIIPVSPGAEVECQAQHQILSSKHILRIFQKIRKSTVRISPNSRNIAFLLRTDKEKSASLTSPLSYDLSKVYSASCRETPYSAQLVRMMAEALNIPDVVVTDRLHVAIMAMHVGKEVYMLDNDYGKLSGVYEVSLKDHPRVHLLSPGAPWPDELQRAWKKLNAPWRLGIHHLTYTLPCAVWRKTKQSIKCFLGK